MIDYIIVSVDFGKHIKNMHIDDERINVLTKIVNKNTKQSKGEVDYKETDHKAMTADLKIY